MADDAQTAAQVKQALWVEPGQGKVVWDPRVPRSLEGWGPWIAGHWESGVGDKENVYDLIKILIIIR